MTDRPNARPEPPPLPPRRRASCVALPLFESLRPARLLAADRRRGSLATTATGAPLRTAFVYFPNGAIPAAWWPTGDGADFELEPHARSRWRRSSKSVQVLGGLDHKTADAGPDGAGDHARGNGTFLTGVRLKKSATDIRAGVSIDQVIASEYRPPDAVPVAGADLRRRPPDRRLRLRLLLRLPVQPRPGARRRRR